MSDLTAAKENIDALYNDLKNLDNQNVHIQNITDVLMQVYKTIDDKKDPVKLVNHLVNYIYVEGYGNIELSKKDESLLMELGSYGKTAGFNGRNMAAYADKSHFYSILEEMPKR